MGVTVDYDTVSVWAALECDHAGCGRHVSARPRDGEIWSVADMVGTVCEWGMEEGWLLNGRAWCPDHREEMSGWEAAPGATLPAGGRPRPS